MLLTACSSIDCDLEGKILCHYAIQDSTGTAKQLAYPLSVIFIREAADSDTIYINQQSSVSSLDLPMSNIAERDRMALKMTIDSITTAYDTICISKTNTPTFEDVDCTARYRHEITGVSSSHHFIDTLIINNPKVSNDASVTNIYIRIRTTL